MFSRIFSSHTLAFLAAVSLAVPSLPAQTKTAAYDVEGVYLKGFMMVQEAEKLER